MYDLVLGHEIHDDPKFLPAAFALLSSHFRAPPVLASSFYHDQSYPLSGLEGNHFHFLTFSTPRHREENDPSRCAAVSPVERRRGQVEVDGAGEEVFVVEGSFVDELGEHRRWSWCRASAAARGGGGGMGTWGPFCNLLYWFV